MRERAAFRDAARHKLHSHAAHGNEEGAMLTEAFEESDLPFKVDVVDWSTIR